LKKRTSEAHAPLQAERIEREAMTNPQIRFIHSKAASSYQFEHDHPFHPIRYELTTSLLEHLGALSLTDKIEPPAYPMDDLLLLGHHQSYIDAIKSLSSAQPPIQLKENAEFYGLHTDDTPYFYKMHEAACAIVAGTVHAVEEVVHGRLQHAYHMAGGLHHALPNRAAGFCVYNDAVIAIRAAQRQQQVRVLYIDTDVHHGDGVQLAFYADPLVCTYSIHETGKFLFPGTGYHYERGIEQGYGTCINVPLEPYTEDESWYNSFEYTLRKTIQHYKPDLIVSQHGCDAHAYDPLSHLHCSIRIYERIPQLIHELAHSYCNGKWVALGGGGYDLFRVVPRAWSLVWLEMNDHPLTKQLNAARLANTLTPLPERWIQQWRSTSPERLPKYWQDEAESIEAIPRREEITAQNKHIAEIAVQDF